MTYKINPSATLLVKRLGARIIIQFLLNGTRNLFKFEVSEVGEKILIKLYEEVSDKDIINEFGVRNKELTQFLSPLIKKGLVVRNRDFITASHFGKRNERTVEFFSSFFKVENTTKQMAEKLFASRVLILGLGGVGTWVTEMLARMGVKRLVLIDNDVVEHSNIPRQAMFTLNDLGRMKVDAARSYCQSVSREIRVDTFSEHLRTVKSLGEKLKDIDLVINCADKPDVDATNALVSRACFKKRIPHILCGGYDGHLSFLSQTVIPFRTSCWFCYADSGIYEKLLDGFEILERNSGDLVGGTICPIGAQVAALQVQEAVRVLTGCSKLAMTNRKGEIDFLNLAINFTKIPKLKHCKLCGS